MHSPAVGIAQQLAGLDERIGSLKHELASLQQQRAALVESLARLVDASGETRLTTPTGSVVMKWRRMVGFPTSSDPERHARLTRALRDHGVWMTYSTLNYSRLKSDWLHGRVPRTVRASIEPFAAEREALIVTSRRRQGTPAPGRYA